MAWYTFKVERAWREIRAHKVRAIGPICYTHQPSVLTNQHIYPSQVGHRRVTYMERSQSWAVAIFDLVYMGVYNYAHEASARGSQGQMLQMLNWRKGVWKLELTL